MDFRIILQENDPNLTHQTTMDLQEETTDYTVTFVIGSCVLVAFVLLGVVASAYLCLTLKKGTLLWVTESNRQLNKDKADEVHNTEKEISGSLKDVKSLSSSQETTQI